MKEKYDELITKLENTLKDNEFELGLLKRYKNITDSTMVKIYEHSIEQINLVWKKYLT